MTQHDLMTSELELLVLQRLSRSAVVPIGVDRGGVGGDKKNGHGVFRRPLSRWGV